MGNDLFWEITSFWEVDSKGVEGWQPSASSVLRSAWTTRWVLDLVGFWVPSPTHPAPAGAQTSRGAAEVGACCRTIKLKSCPEHRRASGKRRLSRFRCEWSSFFFQEGFYGKGAGTIVGWHDYPAGVWHIIL